MLTKTVKKCKVFKMKNSDRYTITDIAKELGVTRQAVYYWIKKDWVLPKRDYRNYPVFTAEDLKSIRKWQRALTKTGPIAPGQKIKPGIENSTRLAPNTWEEIQKIFYK